MTGRLAYMTLVCAWLFGAWAQAQVTKPVVQAEISRMADTAHVEFKGLKNWRYEVQREGGQKVTLTIAPLDEASVARLQAFTDPFIKSVQVNKQGPDGDYLITFDLARNDVESFDYQTDEPSRLILDFYRKADSEVKKTQIRGEAGGPGSATDKRGTKSGTKSATSARKKSGDYKTVDRGRRPPAMRFFRVSLGMWMRAWARPRKSPTPISASAYSTEAMKITIGFASRTTRSVKRL
ncbi:MAG: hypothetical protein HC902_00160 [Calothrix sp. SM1_5_4]|nr:hypothetical protein [Calothrix sp. SM1_5_4]